MNDKVKEIILFNLTPYLNDHLKKIPLENHVIAQEYFFKDVEKISNYAYENFIKDEKIILNIDFIKGLHKSLYPDGYIQKSKDKDGKEFIWMIPGKFREIKIIPNESKEDIYADSKDIESYLNDLIDNFLFEIGLNESEEAKSDIILKFAISFIKIHPFGDGNGRLDGILIDLLCLKYNIPTFGLLKIYKENKMDFINALTKSSESNNLKYIYDFIKKFK